MKAYHTLVTGDSGHGKSTLLAEMAAKFDGRTIIVDPSQGGERKFTGHNIPDTETVRSVRQVPRSRKRVVHVRTDDVDTAAKTARKIGHEIDSPLQIILDEAQQSGLADGEGPVKEGLHEDRDQAIKWVIATQDPRDLKGGQKSEGYNALKQVQFMVWCGPPMPFHRGFADYFSMPRDQFPTKTYEYVVFAKGGDPFKWSVADRGRTSQEYA